MLSQYPLKLYWVVQLLSLYYTLFQVFHAGAPKHLMYSTMN